MENKKLTPIQHGINDYLFSAVLYTAPWALGFKKKTVKLYALMGTNLLVYNMLSTHPVAVKKLIPCRVHYKIDLANVAGLALLTLSKLIRRQPKTLLFHGLFTAAAAANVWLTDWQAPNDKNRYLFI
jgi:hypothetical protein